MNTIALTVLALLAIANAVPVIRQPGRLPMPVALQEKWGHLMHDDPPEVRSRIVGGTPVQSGGRPTQIAMFMSGSFRCGGSLISSRTVLTAAHCVVNQSPANFEIRYDTLTYQQGGKTLGISSIQSHPSYNSGTIDYDIATMTFVNAIEPGTNAAIATLAASGTVPSPGESLIVSGWGRIAAGGALSPNLLQANLAVVSQSDCQSLWGSNPITARMVCAHSTTQSACNGDSGGPLTSADGTQVGVVSWGSSQCLHQNLPNVYAAVGDLRPWIDANTIG